MMKKTLHLCLTILATLFYLTVAGQDSLFSYNDYLNGKLYPERMQNLNWRGDLDSFTWIENNALIQAAAVSEIKPDTLLSLDALKDKTSDLENMRRFPSVTWLDNQRFYFINEQTVFVYDFDADEIKQVNKYPEEAENINLDKNTFAVSYTIANNLFVAMDGQTLSVSEENDADILYGHVPSRNEFGISQGSFWSPDGSQLAFYRTDQREVADYPLVNIERPIALSDPISYPMAGQKSQKVALGIFDPAMNQITYIQTTGPENQYLTSVSWGSAGKYIYIGLLNRDQNHLKMNKYDAATGEFSQTLFEEEKQTYVEPQHDLSFLTGEPEQFIWQSRRDGWNHLYLYNTQGELLKQLTHGDWEVTDFLGFDNEGKNIFYESTEASPIERQVNRINISTGKTKRITRGEGTHSLMASASKEYFLDIFSSMEMARAYYLLDRDGETLATLQMDADPWEDYKIGKTEIFTLTANDGKTDLYCRIIKPIDFDASTKYPVLVYVYGGPHAQLITNSWTGGAGFWLNLMAQRGYVVFTLDNRGSANRGRAFEDIIHRQCGEAEMADQMIGVEYLKSLNYVDTTRIGVDGWSYGGFLTTSLFLRQPGVFKAACAGGPVIDWSWYEAMYGERYMDTPLQNPEGYKKANVLNYIENMEGRLLLIHGTSDPVVMWQNSLTFLDECIQQGKQVDYFVYPGAGHNMYGKARVHLFEKITTFFDEHLK